jgi:hypothetical protein
MVVSSMVIGLRTSQESRGCIPAWRCIIRGDRPQRSPGSVVPQRAQRREPLRPSCTLPHAPGARWGRTIGRAL